MTGRGYRLGFGVCVCVCVKIPACAPLATALLLRQVQQDLVQTMGERDKRKPLLPAFI